MESKRACKITVVTVCRNVAAQLRDTMSSVLGQTYPHLEYIIIDGASTDGTVELLRSAPSHVKWISEPDGGIYDAMNKAVKMATGDWVIFMNAADLFAAPDVLERTAAEISRVPDTVDVVYGGVMKRQADGTLAYKPAELPHRSHRMIFCHQSAFARRDALLRHPFDIKHKLSADYKFFRTLMAEGRSMQLMPFAVSVFDTGGVSNRRRSAGLADNMSVVLEVDGPVRGLPLLAHLLPTWLVARLRGR